MVQAWGGGDRRIKSVGSKRYACARVVSELHSAANAAQVRARGYLNRTTRSTPLQAVGLRAADERDHRRLESVISRPAPDWRTICSGSHMHETHPRANTGTKRAGVHAHMHTCRRTHARLHTHACAHTRVPVS